MTGASFSLWEPIGMIKPGCVLDADIEVKGKYANIKDFKITSQPTGGGEESRPPANKTTYGQDSPEKRRSIEEQKAAEIVCALIVAGKLVFPTGPQGVLTTQEYDPLIYGLRAWLTTRLPASSSTPTASQPVAQKAQSKAEVKAAAYAMAEEEDADGEAMARRHAQKQAPASVPPAKTDDDLFGEKTLEEALKITEGGKLGYFAQQHGIDLKAFVAKVSCAPNQLKTPEQVQAAARVLFGK